MTKDKAKHDKSKQQVNKGVTTHQTTCGGACRIVRLFERNQILVIVLYSQCGGGYRRLVAVIHRVE